MLLNQLEQHGGFDIVEAWFEMSHLFCEFLSIDDQILLHLVSMKMIKTRYS